MHRQRNQKTFNHGEHGEKHGEALKIFRDRPTPLLCYLPPVFLRVLRVSVVQSSAISGEKSIRNQKKTLTGNVDASKFVAQKGGKSAMAKKAPAKKAPAKKAAPKKTTTKKK